MLSPKCIHRRIHIFFLFNSKNSFIGQGGGVNRFFSLYEPKSFQKIFVEWLSTLINIKEKHIAIDGKSSRGSHSKTGGMLHLLHAYLTDDCSFLGQEKTADKSNEITAIPILLETLDLKNALVSIDEIGCQTEIASKIIEKGGDYLLAVKQNQKTLFEDIESAFFWFMKIRNKQSL